MNGEEPSDCGSDHELRVLLTHEENMTIANAHHAFEKDAGLVHKRSKPFSGISKSSKSRAKQTAGMALRRWKIEKCVPQEAAFYIHNKDFAGELQQKVGIRELVLSALSAVPGMYKCNSSDADSSSDDDGTRNDVFASADEREDGVVNLLLTDSASVHDSSIRTSVNRTGTVPCDVKKHTTTRDFNATGDTSFFYENMMELCDDGSSGDEDCSKSGVMEEGSRKNFLRCLQGWAAKCNVSNAALTTLMAILLIHRPMIDYTSLEEMKTGRKLMKVTNTLYRCSTCVWEYNF
jgi:hypothetical protein